MSTITITATDFLTTTATGILTTTVTRTVASASASSTVRATPQGGILEGVDPSQYSTSNPIILFIIQASIIIIFCRLLHYPLSLLRQPRVIAEVIGGILLGPSVMGRIPGFTDAIFPSAATPNLSLVANIGLVLFLFLVGLEVDLRFFASNWKIALSVGTAGMALPFGLGCAIAWGLYNEFHDEPGTVHISFGTYMLFIGVAMAITAFPVLCRILTELKLLSTNVGIVVLSAGVSNDVVGWILLALCVALVNASSGITALWILLCSAGYVLFLVYAVRPAFLWILRRSNALTEGPSQGIVTLTLMIALASAFFTGVIGVHPIFGAFLAGLICPHEGGFAIKVTEKVEDLVSAIFLPLYFALSGLSTDLGMLDNAITWAYVIGIIAVAFFGKVIGATLAARLNGLVWRESLTIGALMSCKGLVELIVLNIGFQARILSKRTFTMFVVMALITTFATTPLTAALYPPAYRQKLEAWRRGEIDWDTGRPLDGSSAEHDAAIRQKIESARIRNVLVHLQLDSMPSVLAFVSLLGNKSTETIRKQHPSRRETNPAQCANSVAGDESTQSREGSTSTTASTRLHGVRLLELTERGSTVMKVSEVEEYSFFDPILNTFRVLGQFYNLAISGEVSIIPTSSYADTLVSKAADESSDLLLLPWSETGSLSDAQPISSDSERNKLVSDTYTSFVTRTLDDAPCHVAVFINQGFRGMRKAEPPTLNRTLSLMSTRSHRDFAGHRGDTSFPLASKGTHVFMPFFGDADSRVALRLVLQLAENPEVTATVVRYELPDEIGAEVTQEIVTVTEKDAGVISSNGNKPQPNVSTRQVDSDAAFFATLEKSIPATLASRVLFETVSTSTPSVDVLKRAGEEAKLGSRNGSHVVVLGRHVDRLRHNGVIAGCLGSIGEQIATSGLNTSLLVVQAKGSSIEL